MESAFERLCDFCRAQDIGFKLKYSRLNKQSPDKGWSVMLLGKNFPTRRSLSLAEAVSMAIEAYNSAPER